MTPLYIDFSSYVTLGHTKTGRYKWKKLAKVFLKLLHIQRLPLQYHQCLRWSYQWVFTPKINLCTIKMVVDAAFLKALHTVSRIFSQPTVTPSANSSLKGSLNSLLTKTLRHSSHVIWNNSHMCKCRRWQLHHGWCLANSKDFIHGKMHPNFRDFQMCKTLYRLERRKYDIHFVPC